MNTQQAINYNRIAEAIDFIKANFKEQPSLELIAQHVNLSPFHFQRLFTDWAGVSPKQFIAYLSLTYAKSILKEKEHTLFDVAVDTGLSGSGRLHDLFVKLEGMSPGEYKNGGEGLRINYHFSENLFGRLLIASTGKGICYMAFIEDEEAALRELKDNFPNATYVQEPDEHQQNALKIFSRGVQPLKQIKVHLKGTDFQLKVWESLLKIPMGVLSSYGSIAGAVGNPKASRAVGSAIGDNPVAFIIPCHRVIQAAGTYGQYRWGSTRKSAMIGWEAAAVSR
ncbi:MAG: methylated-DNA--[protein]-cysteine S-methyltransferase [Bacteroidota bacterium]